MPFRSPKMYSFIFGFQRRTWWPKCTPASNNSFIVTVTKQLSPLCQLVYVLAATGAFTLESNQSKSRQWNFEISNLKFQIDLSLRELESFARALLAVLLAFLDPRIARDQACVFQGRPQVAVVLNQSARNSVTNRAGLTRRSAAGHIDEHIELGRRLSQLHRLTNNHPQRLVRKINIKRSAIDLNVARAGSQIDSRRRALAPSSSVVFNLCHVLILFYFAFLREGNSKGCGCCAV